MVAALRRKSVSPPRRAAQAQVNGSDAISVTANLKNLPTAVQDTWGGHVDQAGIDEMVDRAMRMGKAPNIIATFNPRSGWLWRQWNGTVLQQTWRPAVSLMLFSLLLVGFMEFARKMGDHRWEILEVPIADDRWVARMKGFTTMWGYLLTMATFVNSFFLSQACTLHQALNHLSRLTLLYVSH